MHAFNDHFPKIEPSIGKIWRYMSVTKFLNLLTTSALYYVRLDKFEDPYEGYVGEISFNETLNVITDGKPNSNPLFNVMMKQAFQEARSYNFVSCWHENDYESAAMWDLYSNRNEGVAILSDGDRLAEAITDERKLHLFRVSYIDYSKETLPLNNIMFPSKFKRKSFEHEREVRSVFYDVNMSIKKPPVSDHGVPFNIDVNKLIETVMIAPNSPKWVYDTVNKLVKEMGFKFDVIQSELYKLPT